MKIRLIFPANCVCFLLIFTLATLSVARAEEAPPSAPLPGADKGADKEPDSSVFNAQTNKVGGASVYRDADLSSEVIVTYPSGVSVKLSFYRRNHFLRVYFEQLNKGALFGWIHESEIELPSNVVLLEDPFSGRSHAGGLDGELENLNWTGLGAGMVFALPSLYQSAVGDFPNSESLLELQAEYGRHFSKSFSLFTRIGRFSYSKSGTAAGTSTAISYSHSAYFSTFHAMYDLFTWGRLTFSVHAGGGLGIGSASNTFGANQASGQSGLIFPILFGFRTDYKISSRLHIRIDSSYQLLSMGAVPYATALPALNTAADLNLSGLRLMGGLNFHF